MSESPHPSDLSPEQAGALRTAMAALLLGVRGDEGGMAALLIESEHGERVSGALVALWAELARSGLDSDGIERFLQAEVLALTEASPDAAA